MFFGLKLKFGQSKKERGRKDPNALIWAPQLLSRCGIVKSCTCLGMQREKQKLFFKGREEEIDRKTCSM